MNHAFAIGTVAARSGVKVPTIRYYETVGMLPAPTRTDGNRRVYSHGDVKRLAFIRHARELGFELDAIRALLKLQDQPGQSCESADSIANARLDDVRQRIRSLRALEAELQRMVEGCSHGRVESCRVIEILADHGECRFHADDAQPAGAGGYPEDRP